MSGADNTEQAVKAAAIHKSSRGETGRELATRRSRANFF
jgi:hypothetical protein